VNSRHFDISSVNVIGEGLKLAPVDRATNFIIQAANIEANDVSVKVTGKI
jgi:hypothetical protein